MMDGHNGVYPEDVQAVLPSVVGHRLEPAQDSEIQTADIGESILEAVPVT